MNVITPQNSAAQLAGILPSISALVDMHLLSKSFTPTEREGHRTILMEVAHG